MLRLAAFAVTSALAAPAALAAAGPPLPPLSSLPVARLLNGGQPDRLTIVVSGTGNPRADGEYLLECEPVGGNHPEAEQACARLGEFAKAGKDPFAADNRRQLCTMQDGGPATAHVTGTWQGHKVDTTFRRKNGCEISRWNDLEPVLPPARA
ncbi:SSI family serine proteinase inhibitor [Streptomyces goshikiensis]|uniref:SSI family serine proteinase inhibitor n=1 Tax=Streptomyces goshikiensis TaxID=1942 RepID=UPI0036BD9ECC